MRLRTAFLAGIAAVVASVLIAKAQLPGGNSTLNSVFTLAYDNSTMKRSYSSSVTFGATAASATDVCVLSGSATRTIKVRRIGVAAIATTAVTAPIAIVKRSTANSGGSTTVTQTPVPYDSSNGAATAVSTFYTANPTTGTTVGILADPLFSIGNLTTGGAQIYGSGLNFGELASPIVLRGVAQSVAVNLQGQSFSGLSLTCTFEWTEDTDT